MPQGAAHQTSVSTRLHPALVGLPVFVGSGEEYEALINKDPQAAEVYTDQITGAADDTVYGVNLTAPVTRSISIDSGTGATVNSIAAALAAAWNADPIARGYAEATVVTDTVTFTGVYPGVAITIEEDESAGSMTLTNTAQAAQGDAVPFGRGMISLEWDAEYQDEFGILAQSSKLTAQVDTIQPVYALGDRYTVSVFVEGEEYSVTVAADTDTATTVTAIVTALNLQLPADTVVVTESGGTDVILTSELAGRPFVTGIGSEIGGNITLASTTGGVDTDINLALAGVSLRSGSVQSSSLPEAATDPGEYPATAVVSVMKRNAIWVEVDAGTTITPKSPVYIELAPGATAGRFYTSGGATRALLDQSLAQWRRASRSDDQTSLAQLSLHLRH